MCTEDLRRFQRSVRHPDREREDPPRRGLVSDHLLPAAFPLDGGTPAPTPDCPNLPPSKELTCGRETSRFYPDVEAAIGQLLKEKPELFDFTDIAVRTDWPKIANQEGYLQGLVQILKAKGYCARWDGKELAVKNTSEFNEQFAVILSFIWIRRGEWNLPE